MIKTLIVATALGAMSVTGALAKDVLDDKSTVAIVFDQALPNVPGKSIRAVLVEYEPGGTSPAHTHPASAFIFATVLEGAIRSQVNNGPVTIYRAGESFSRVPGRSPRRQRKCEQDGTRPPARRVRRQHG